MYFCGGILSPLCETQSISIRCIIVVIWTGVCVLNVTVETRILRTRYNGNSPTILKGVLCLGGTFDGVIGEGQSGKIHRGGVVVN